MKSLVEMQEEIWAWCLEKGWEPDEKRTFGDEVALLHSEVSEALEAYRIWKLEDGTVINAKIGLAKPEGVGSEFADILIRLLHYSRARGIDLDFEYARKMEYNRTRAFKHGGKTL